MNGVLIGWLTTLGIGLGVILIVVIATVLLPRTMRTRTASFFCPWRRREVTVRYLTCDGEHPHAVMTCTAFADPTIVTCGAPCVNADDHRRPLTVRPRVGLLSD
jgi:hypothetical protein